MENTPRGIRILDGLALALSRAGLVVSLTVLVVMLAGTVYDVVSRFLFDKPIVGVIEFSGSYLPAFTFLGLAMTQRLKGNINVTFGLQLLSPRRRKVAEFFGILLSLLFAAAMAWQASAGAMFSYRHRRVSLGRRGARAHHLDLAGQGRGGRRPLDALSGVCGGAPAHAGSTHRTPGDRDHDGGSEVACLRSLSETREGKLDYDPVTDDSCDAQRGRLTSAPGGRRAHLREFGRRRVSRHRSAVRLFDGLRHVAGGSLCRQRRIPLHRHPALRSHGPFRLLCRHYESRPSISGGNGSPRCLRGWPWRRSAPARSWERPAARAWPPRRRWAGSPCRRC